MFSLTKASNDQGQTRSLMWARLAGLILLVVLFTRVDLVAILNSLQKANLHLVGLAVVLILPMIAVKAFRWQGLLAAQEIRYPPMASFLSYLGSMFIGFITPGRLGEFVRAWHVSRDCRVSTGRALASVLIDRLFDFSALLATGIVGLMAVGSIQSNLSIWIIFTLSVLLLTILLALLTRRRGSLNWIPRRGWNLGVIDQTMLTSSEWFSQLYSGLKESMLNRLAVSAVLTAAAYGLLFVQSYLLAMAVGVQASFLTVTYAMALGSLVTLLPVSISGVGTREAAITIYLGVYGVSAETALSFSLLVFITFYVIGGIMGAIAWWLKPIPLSILRGKT